MSFRQVVVVVEGQTEEAFITQVLGPYLGPAKIALIPIVSHTSQEAGGRARKGGGDWSRYRRKLQKLTREPQWDLVTTMIDFYGYPDNAPGARCHPANAHQVDECLRERTAAMAADIEGTWLPFLMLHEFEALVIAAGSTMPAVFGDPKAPGRFQQMIAAAGNAELVNDHPNTVPSVRVQKEIEGYAKVRDGVAMTQEAAFANLLELCPRFAIWVEQLAG